MKRKTLWTVIVLVLVVVVAATAVRTEFGGRHGWCGRGWHRHAPLGYVARELNLSDAQFADARSVVAAERPTVAALLKELLGGAHQMADTTAGGTFDEARVKAIAAAEGDTFARLLVEKELLKSRIYSTVLNETQRQNADKLQQHYLGRLDNAVSRLQKQSK